MGASSAMRADSELSVRGGAGGGGDAVARFAGALLARLRAASGRPGKGGSSGSASGGGGGKGAALLPPRVGRSVSLSGQPISGSTHAVTSVAGGARHVAAGSASTVRVTAALEAAHISPFLLVEHVGPVHSQGGPGPPAPRAGLQALVYVLRGEVEYRAGDAAPRRLRAHEAALLDAGRGAVVDVRPQPGPLELLHVWVNVPRAVRDCGPSVRFSRALPEYVLSDHATGAEQARVRVALGDAVPVRAAESVRAATKALQARAQAAGVYDVEVGRAASVRISLHSIRVLLYVREGAARIGGRVVKKGSLAVLHGPPAGCIVVDSEGEDGCSCVVLQGDAMTGKVEWTPAGFAAGSAREMRRTVKRHVKGEMANVFVQEG